MILFKTTQDKVLAVLQSVCGIVERRTFLGELLDYQVRVGQQSVRVQKGRYDRGPQEGENCRLHFLKPLWFPVENAD